jgi:hypothetical protein
MLAHIDWASLTRCQGFILGGVVGTMDNSMTGQPAPHADSVHDEVPNRRTTSTPHLVISHRRILEISHDISIPFPEVQF